MAKTDLEPKKVPVRYPNQPPKPAPKQQERKNGDINRKPFNEGTGPRSPKK